jgi:hypothetical protein
MMRYSEIPRCYDCDHNAHWGPIECAACKREGGPCAKNNKKGTNEDSHLEMEYEDRFRADVGDDDYNY